MDEHAEEAATGPNGGRRLTDGDFALELAIFESRRPARVSRLGHRRRPAAGSEQRVACRRARATRRYGRSDRLHATSRILTRHPNRARAAFIRRHRRRAPRGEEHRFEYESYEGRTTIAADIARDAGIETATARARHHRRRAAALRRDRPGHHAVREVHARFAGVIRSVASNVGDTVRAGDTLATIESNESLQTYSVTAPIARHDHAAPRGARRADRSPNACSRSRTSRRSGPSSTCSRATARACARDIPSRLR